MYLIKRRPARSTLASSSAASEVYKGQAVAGINAKYQVKSGGSGLINGFKQGRRGKMAVRLVDTNRLLYTFSIPRDRS